MTHDHDFARWLSGRLVERGISQRQLAERSGVHHSSISRLVRGHRQPTHRTARRLTEVLDTPRPGVPTLTAFLRRDPFLVESDVERIVSLYRAIAAQRQRGQRTQQVARRD